MKRQPKEVTSLELRRALPEVALRMETEYLLHEAEKLGLLATVTRGKRICRIGIELTHFHTLRLSPVDKGAQGTGEWFTFMNRNHQCKKSHTEYVMRVHAEIIDQFLPKENRIESVTVAGTSLDLVLRKALGAYELLTGKLLAPKFYINEGEE